MSDASKQMQSAIPTSFDFNIGSNINGSLSGLRTSSSSQSSSGYAVASSPINLNVKLGDITVQGSADEKILAKIQQSQKDAVNSAIAKVEDMFFGIDGVAFQRSYSTI